MDDMRKAELVKAIEGNGMVGQRLLSETDEVRVWRIELAPGERVGFHMHVLNYFRTATSAGKSRSTYADGRVAETEYQAGTTRHYTFGPGESMVHDLENIGGTVLSFTTAELKIGSANAPLTLPDSAYKDCR
jgi:beta-alanine degradation protein BauB